MLTTIAMKLSAGALAVAVLGSANVAPQGTLPDRTWLGVKKILILSQLDAAAQTTSAMTANALCQKVQALASSGAPVPVTCVRLGDPRLEDADAAVLVIQATISDAAAPNQLFLFTIRRQNIGGLEPAPGYFGAAPRALPFSGEIKSSELEAALQASLAQILPWLNQSTVKLQPNRRGE